MNRQAFSRRAFDRSAFRSPFRSPFGGAGLSPLQQAVIAAWDGGGHNGLMPAVKGGLDFPSFNSPSQVSVGGITFRDCNDPTDAYFAQAYNPALSLLAGVRTLRMWVRSGAPVLQRIVMGIANSNTAFSSGNEFVIRQSQGGSGNLRLYYRTGVSAGTFLEFIPEGNVSSLDLLRIEILNNGSGFDIWAHNLTTEQSWEASIATPAYYDAAESHVPYVLDTRHDNYLSSARFQWGPMIIMDRAMTAEERAADLSPRYFASL